MTVVEAEAESLLEDLAPVKIIHDLSSKINKEEDPTEKYVANQRAYLHPR